LINKPSLQVEIGSWVWGASLLQENCSLVGNIHLPVKNIDILVNG
jgi:hypothetical protein